MSYVSNYAAVVESSIAERSGWHHNGTDIAHGYLQLFTHSVAVHTTRACYNCKMQYTVSVLKDLFASQQFSVDVMEASKVKTGPPMSLSQFASLLTNLRAVWTFAFTMQCPRCQCQYDYSFVPVRSIGMAYTYQTSTKMLQLRNPQKWVYPIEVQWAIWRFEQSLGFCYQVDDQSLVAHGMIDMIRFKYGTTTWPDASDLWGVERADLCAAHPNAQTEWIKSFPPAARRAERYKSEMDARCGKIAYGYNSALFRTTGTPPPGKNLEAEEMTTSAKRHESDVLASAAIDSVSEPSAYAYNSALFRTTGTPPLRKKREADDVTTSAKRHKSDVLASEVDSAPEPGEATVSAGESVSDSDLSLEDDSASDSDLTSDSVSSEDDSESGDELTEDSSQVKSVTNSDSDSYTD